MIENPYFPAKEHTSLKVHAEYYDRGFVDETADAEINRIKIYDEGSVYKLTIHIKPNMSSWYFKSGDIMSMYFYVTADKIYWILPYAQLEPGGKSIHFYDDDDLLVKTFDIWPHELRIPVQEQEPTAGQTEWTEPVSASSHRITFCCLWGHILCCSLMRPDSWH